MPSVLKIRSDCQAIVSVADVGLVVGVSVVVEVVVCGAAVIPRVHLIVQPILLA